MNLNESIRKKLTLFSSLRFVSPYQQILEEMCDESGEKQVKRLASFQSHSKPAVNLWLEVVKAMFHSKREYGVNYLAACYLKSKAKHEFKQFKSIAKKEAVRVDRVIEKYFEMSLEALRRRRSILGINAKGIRKSLTPMMTFRRANQSNLSFDNQFNKSKGSNEEASQKKEEEGENEPECNKRVINIFVGKLNIKSFLRKKQTFKLEKGDYCQYFIVSDTPQPNPKTRSSNLKKSSKGRYPNLLSVNLNKKLTSSFSLQQISTNDPLSSHLSCFRDKILQKHQKESNKVKNAYRSICLYKGSSASKHDNNSFLFPSVSIRDNSALTSHKRTKELSNCFQWYNMPVNTSIKKGVDYTVNYINKHDLYY